MNKILALVLASGAASLVAAGPASAHSYPKTIVGTWNIRANDTQVFTFTVQNQSSAGSCPLITGVLPAPNGTNDQIVGFYCPSTGLVSFERNSGNTGATFQVFTGQVSWTGSGGVLTQMTGNFSNYAGGDNTGAFAFTAELPGS
jgi:hypothetical protein